MLIILSFFYKILQDRTYVSNDQHDHYIESHHLTTTRSTICLDCSGISIIYISIRLNHSPYMNTYTHMDLWCVNDFVKTPDSGQNSNTILIKKKQIYIISYKISTFSSNIIWCVYTKLNHCMFYYDS